MEGPRQLGRYRIERLLGQGQMGTVYLATDPLIDRAVAIKLLRARPELRADEADEFRARFEREVQIAARLSHPHVVGILDVGWQDDAMFIVMECVAGSDLQTEIEQHGPLPPARVLEIGEALAQALDAAHAEGIIHRDLKPANVLLRQDGTVKLTDFGVAHVVDSRMTRTGMTYGTPAFMSPEQATAATLGPASDQFSLAALLYFTATGEVPFAGASAAAVMYRLVNDDPVPPESLNPNVPAGLSRALLRALAKNPDQRYRSCSAMVRALRDGCGSDCSSRGPVGSDRAAVAQVAGATMGPISGDRPPSSRQAFMETVPEAGRQWLAKTVASPRHALGAVALLVAVALLGWAYSGSAGGEDGAAVDTSAMTGSLQAAAEEGASQPAASSSRAADVPGRERAGAGPGGRGRGQAETRGGSEARRNGGPTAPERGSGRPLDVEGSLPAELAERTDNATRVLAEMVGMSDGIPARLLDDAQCVAVIPGVIKVGFGFGGRHGKGLVSCRAQDGWSPPAFMSLTGGGFGLQIGAQSTDFVLVFNRPNAARRLTASQLTLGGDASVSGGPVGRTAEVGTDVRMQEEIYSYSRSKGLFAGVSLEGATLRYDEDANRKAYGRRVTPDELLLSREGTVTPELAEFLSSLETVAR